MVNFVAYYRVSTSKQGASGLGLEAQQAAVARFLTPTDTLLAEYTEIESGKKHANRPELLAALAECRRAKATLVVAKLDRLSRKVSFLSSLMDSGVDFVCCDNPHATRLTLHIFAAMAEHEAQLISERTKAGLAAAKARGVKLGSPRAAETIAAARRACMVQNAPKDVIELMQTMRKQGKSHRYIARKLNGLNIRTPRGNAWYADSVIRQLARASNLS
jgi:DNA invertase Pin-like site-specific DNA recombinase